jgi:acyl-CoA dehydrogenase
VFGLVLVIAIAVVWALAYFRAPLWVWTLAVAGTLVYGCREMLDQPVALAFIWLLFVTIALIFNVPALRSRVITSHILPAFRRALPAMSQTEREALEAGGVWWEGELFSGWPRWQRLLGGPAPKLTAEEQAFVDGPVQTLCQMLDDWKITQELHDLSPETWQYIKDQGFFGMIIPKEYGGLGFSALAHSAVVMKLAGRSISGAVTVMVPNSLGPAELLLRYGTDEQKRHYLPRLAKGKEIPCFALTGPEAGSDASSIPDKGVVTTGIYKGRETLGIRLNWEKRYITLGPVATVLGLAFRLYDPQHLLGGKEDLGITLALIPTDTPGVEIGQRHFPLNQAFQNGPNRGKDVFIPMSWVIGGQDRVGQGWRMLMECLAAGRAISLPSLSTGAGKLVCRASGAYARIRKQFKLPIGYFEGVEEVLARMAAYTYMMDAARVNTAQAVDQGHEPAVASAIVKYNLTERMRQIVNDAMDVQGGSGICMGPRNFLGRAYQAIPISITVEGANILTRTLIIFGQGAVRCHPFVLKEMQAARNEDAREGLKAFDRALFSHIGLVISNVGRTLFLSLTGGRLAKTPEAGPVADYFRQVTRLSAAFALVSDLAMFSLGGSLKRREKLSGRLADVLSQLYLISMTLKRYIDAGRCSEDLPLVRWSCNDALFKAQTALLDLLRNFPIRPLGVLLRMMIFPWGKAYHSPSDALGHQAASLLLAPSSVRDRLTDGMYITRDGNEPLGRLETALALVCEADPLEKKLAQAIRGGRVMKTDEAGTFRGAIQQGVLSEADVELIQAAAAIRREVIQVDDFAPDHWRQHRR